MFDEPEEDDITTTDHVHWYQNGKCVVVTDGDDPKPALDAYMKREGFYPNVWFISDHGNAHLIDFDG